MELVFFFWVKLFLEKEKETHAYKIVDFRDLPPFFEIKIMKIATSRRKNF